MSCMLLKIIVIVLALSNGIPQLLLLLYSVGPQPCPNYSIDIQYIDAIFEDVQYTEIIQASICLGNTYGDLCYSPYFTDDVVIDICRNNVYSGVTSKCCSVQ